MKQVTLPQSDVFKLSLLLLCDLVGEYLRRHNYTLFLPVDKHHRFKKTKKQNKLYLYQTSGLLQHQF